jgi:hypothetical protein
VPARERGQNLCLGGVDREAVEQVLMPGGDRSHLRGLGGDDMLDAILLLGPHPGEIVGEVLSNFRARPLENLLAGRFPGEVVRRRKIEVGSSLVHNLIE